jgi:hypothetical protein
MDSRRIEGKGRGAVASGMAATAGRSQRRMKSIRDGGRMEVRVRVTRLLLSATNARHVVKSRVFKKNLHLARDRRDVRFSSSELALSGHYKLYYYGSKAPQLYWLQNSIYQRKGQRHLGYASPSLQSFILLEHVSCLASRPIPAQTLIEISPVLLFSVAEYDNHGKHTALHHYTFKWRDGRMALALGLGQLSCRSCFARAI